MKPIYEPKGAAKEYGDLALNIYTGCPHRCFYCFAPSVLRGWRSSLVREMAVMIHGVDGAVSINTRENTQQMKHERNGEKHDTEENEE